MKRKAQKFKAGDEVMDTMMEERFTVGRVHFDPCDGWEYAPWGKDHRWYFEETLELIVAAGEGSAPQ